MSPTLNLGGIMLLCMRDARKERERKEAELFNPAKPQTSKPPTPPATRAADASR